MLCPIAFGKVVATELACITGYLSRDSRYHALHKATPNAFFQPDALETVHRVSIVCIFEAPLGLNLHATLDKLDR